MIEAIRVFQIIQEQDDLIEIKVVPGPAYSDSLWRAVGENLKNLHPAMRLKVSLVDDLRPEPGKNSIRCWVNWTASGAHGMISKSTEKIYHNPEKFKANP